MSESIKSENPNSSITGDKGKYNMHYGASPKLFDLAEELRSKMTQAEEILWNVIKINEWHIKFRRQHPMANYIADFYCHNVKLVIELDGGYHENKEVKIYDAFRENEIKAFGVRVLRFKNEEVLHNLDKVLGKIGDIVSEINKEVTEKAESSNNSPLGDGGKLFVIKIGGNILDNLPAQQLFLQQFAAVNAKKILVHGGGKIATTIGKQMGLTPNYINGRRITDEATIDLVTMVYGGLINKKLVAALQSMYCNAIGLTGADANIIPAGKRPVAEIDYGFVGDIKNESIAANNLQTFLENNMVPVVAPLTHDGQGQMLNTNADTIASALAIALSKQYDVRLIYCFEKKGVLENVDDEASVISSINKKKYQQLLHDKKLADGILPKIDNAFAAIDSGVKEVLIGHADDLLQNITENVKGTLFTK